MDARGDFIAECGDLLDQVETQLLQLENARTDRELLDGIFRCVHSIKGLAGMVDEVETEWFAHVVESVLDRLRTGFIAADGRLVSLLLACVDHLRFLCGTSSSGERHNPLFADTDRARLIGELAPYLDSENRPGPLPVGVPTQPPASWHIAVRFSTYVLRQGLDPLYFLRHLERLGTLSDLCTDTSALPPLASFDPEACYLGVRLRLSTVADKTAIEGVFAFLGDQCELRILPTDALLVEQQQRLRALPEDARQLGEMLLDIGAITPAELRRALETQASEAACGDPGAACAVGEILVRQGAVPAGLVAFASERQRRVQQKIDGEADGVRVPRGALEQLLSLVANLASVSHNAQRYTDRAGPALAGELAALDALTGDMLEQARRLLSLRAGEAFRHLHRVVRDVSTQTGHPVDLLFEGEDLQVDRLQAAHLCDAVLHLVRNALDHGIESPDERARAGKRQRGTLRVAVAREGAELIIMVSDDGRGIDAEAVRRIAVRKGLLREESRRSRQELHELIFTPGFSTRTEASRLSGRGVGLDVVRRGVRELGGMVQVSSEPGQGTTFSIRVPALSTIPADVSTNVLHYPPASRPRAA